MRLFSTGRSAREPSKMRLFSGGQSPVTLTPGDPDPARWKLIRGQEVGRCTVVEIMYPDALNYEGRKILVYEARSLDEVIHANKGWLDPHFSDDPNVKGPIARFEPTERGWAMALACAGAL
ncbi:hypothetical protein Ccr5_gp214c [Caulobacter phage Ccr5]|nr:hypothetical protein Ccr5_gp214c [Caulobacter phage Ccr5]